MEYSEENHQQAQHRCNARMTHTGDKFSLITENQRIYDKLYQEVYQKMYDNLSPLYKSIHKVTGYPK